MCVSAVVEGLPVDWRCFVERYFIKRNLRQSSVNRLWDVVGYTRRVIRFLVHIKRDVIWLVIWHVFTTGEVEGGVKEVYDVFVGFDRHFKAMLAEDVA